MKTKRLLSVLTLTALLPLSAVADVWQDPETKVNYEYTVGQSEASVKAGSRTAGSPDVSGDITILSNFTVDGNEYRVTSIGDYAFVERYLITSVTIPNSVTSIGNYAFAYCQSLTSVNIPNSVTSIGSGAFYICRSLTSVTIPNSVTNIGDGAFSQCGLTTLTIPGSVTTIGDISFAFCNNLTSVIISNGVTDIVSRAFYGCANLKTVTIPSSVMRIDYYAFEGCTGLTSVHISDLKAWCKIRFEGDPSNPSNPLLKYAQQLFLNDEEIKDLVLPNNKVLGKVGDFAFTGFKGLTSITFSEDPYYHSSQEVGAYAFAGCTGLTSVTFPSRLAIGEYAFNNCSGLTSVTFPMQASIGNHAFEGCSSLTTISFGEKENEGWVIKSLDSKAFANCPKLTHVYCYDELPTGTNKDAFDVSDIEKATLHVPTAAIDAFKSTEPWSHFKYIISLDETTSASLVKSNSPVQISAHEGVITVNAKDDGLPVAVYAADGQLYGTSIVKNSKATIPTTLPAGSIVIVKCGKQAMKLLVR